MWTAIVNLVSSIFGSVSQGIGASAASLAQVRASNQSRVDYERGKTASIYGMISTEKTMLLIVVAFGIALIGFIIYKTAKNNGITRIK